MIVYALALGLGLSAPSAGTISDAAALRIARSVGTYAGYPPSRDPIIEYEITDPPGRPAYPGYVTVQLMSNAHAIFDLSIDRRTGKVYDFLRCVVFAYPFLERKSGSVHPRGSSAQRTRSLMYRNGCPTFRTLRRRGE